MREIRGLQLELNLRSGLNCILPPTTSTPAPKKDVEVLALVSWNVTLFGNRVITGVISEDEVILKHGEPLS